MKVCCCPVRPLLYTLAILGILRSGAQIYWTSSLIRDIPTFAYIAFNLFLIYSIKQKEIKLLKWAQGLSLVCLVLSVIPFLLFPVIGASLMASGKLDNFTDIPDDVFANWTIPDRRFFMGTVVGFTVELGTGFMILVDLLKYYLVSKIWRAAVETDQFVNPESFHTP